MSMYDILQFVINFNFFDVCFITFIQIVNQRAMLSSNTPPACTLQVSSRGIRVCDFDEKQILKSSPKAVKKNKGKDKDKEKDKSKVCIAQSFIVMIFATSIIIPWGHVSYVSIPQSF